ncbi:hypothetical protein HanRHA438_Chr03g0145181 [Helianthus annuus]|nr:hypothetical protein HanIR_Chr03g0145341 [Helianthus annuus]KAJ0937721.1 hypothetical protein HanRHA438_Chr03g0145181 [Helianthus annuus]
MKMLSSNDEVFHLSRTMAAETIYIARSQRTPITMNWDEYAISFYLKMCTCFGVDYKLSEDDCQKKEMPLEEQANHICWFIVSGYGIRSRICMLIGVITFIHRGMLLRIVGFDEFGFRVCCARFWTPNLAAKIWSRVCDIHRCCCTGSGDWCSSWSMS